MSGNGIDIATLCKLSAEESAKKAVEIGVEKVVGAAMEYDYGRQWEKIREHLWLGAHAIMCDTRMGVYHEKYAGRTMRSLSDAERVAANAEAAERYAPYQEIHQAIRKTMEVK